MATIYNSELLKELKDGGKLQQSRDIIPTQLADKIVPVMEVNPKLMRRCNVLRSGSSAVSGSISLYTTPTDRDFFLTSLHLGIIKDAACDIATGAVNLGITVDGTARNFISIPVITLTAQNIVRDVAFCTPIKVDRGTSISITGTYTAGVMSRTGGLSGFYSDNPNA